MNARNLLGEAREAWRYRELLNNLVDRELQVRYKNSALGVIWSLANPIVRALILVVVFKYVVPFAPDNYSAYVLAAFFPWTYFLTGILDAGESVSRQMALVKKVYFPRELLPLATTIANLRHFFLSLGVLGIYLVVLYAVSALDGNPGTPGLPPPTIFLLPVLVLMQTLLIGGIAFYISAMNVFFEDVKFLTAVVLDLLFYGVPIIYFLEQVNATKAIPEALKPIVWQLFLLNPVTVILASYRSFLLPSVWLEKGSLGLDKPLHVNLGFETVTPAHFCFAFVVCLLVFVSGYAFFNSRKWRFVERQ
ncbi:MAG: ABC transporter permease [Armatimonadota bacterium]